MARIKNPEIQEAGLRRWIASGLLLFLVWIGAWFAIRSSEAADPAVLPPPREASLGEQFEKRKKSAEGAKAPAAKLKRLPSPTPVPSPTHSPSPTPLPSPSAVLAPIDLKAAARYRRDFAQAARQALKNFDRDQKRIRSEGQDARKERLAQWKRTEKARRHQFFEENEKGPERRKFVQDFIARREVMLKLIKDEEKREKDELDSARAQYVEGQELLRLENEKFLRQGLRPPATLWAK